ncbi:hypothetical protein BXZ70DRAFT_1006307 [Cristinia sonorae]|uniref:Uncharacterized protein n=1 Tax=Cristinia sonorae TaxID=1940300 RepID=A0A8K0UTU8_9AGAR|nr:hypothetical protein BXZ70DRAFT_1006307 [Cristinia sonorae]
MSQYATNFNPAKGRAKSQTSGNSVRPKRNTQVPARFREGNNDDGAPVAKPARKTRSNTKKKVCSPEIVESDDDDGYEIVKESLVDDEADEASHDDIAAEELEADDDEDLVVDDGGEEGVNDTEVEDEDNEQESDYDEPKSVGKRVTRTVSKRVIVEDEDEEEEPDVRTASRTKSSNTKFKASAPVTPVKSKGKGKGKAAEPIVISDDDNDSDVVEVDGNDGECDTGLPVDALNQRLFQQLTENVFGSIGRMATSTDVDVALQVSRGNITMQEGRIAVGLESKAAVPSKTVKTAAPRKVATPSKLVTPSTPKRTPRPTPVKKSKVQSGIDSDISPVNHDDVDWSDHQGSDGPLPSPVKGRSSGDLSKTSPSPQKPKGKKRVLATSPDTTPKARISPDKKKLRTLPDADPVLMDHTTPSKEQGRIFVEGTRRIKSQVEGGAVELFDRSNVYAPNLIYVPVYAAPSNEDKFDVLTSTDHIAKHLYSLSFCEVVTGDVLKLQDRHLVPYYLADPILMNMDVNIMSKEVKVKTIQFSVGLENLSVLTSEGFDVLRQVVTRGRWDRLITNSAHDNPFHSTVAVPQNYSRNTPFTMRTLDGQPKVQLDVTFGFTMGESQIVNPVLANSTKQYYQKFIEIAPDEVELLRALNARAFKLRQRGLTLPNVDGYMCIASSQGTIQDINRSASFPQTPTRNRGKGAAMAKEALSTEKSKATGYDANTFLNQINRTSYPVRGPNDIIPVINATSFIQGDLVPNNADNVPKGQDQRSKFDLSALLTQCPSWNKEIPPDTYVAVIHTVSTYGQTPMFSFSLSGVVILAWSKDFIAQMKRPDTSLTAFLNDNN